jgi:hypothetical protein
VAALGKWDWTRESGSAVQEAEDHARTAASEVGQSGRRLVDDVADEVERAAEEAAHRAETIQANGKRRFWRPSHDAGDAVAAADVTTEETPTAGKEAEKEKEAESAGEEHRGKAGLFWGGAGIGLALYALLDAERRDRVLRLANEASVQVQELVRDLQGYDDEF